MSFNSITEAQKKEWKAKYGKLFQVVVKTDTGKANFIVRKPNRSVINALANYGAKNQIEKVNDILIENCVLGGDMQLIEQDGAVYVEVLKQIGELLTQVEGSIKKL